MLLSNLFDKKKVFLEIVDLKINYNIPDGSVTLVDEEGKIYIIGGNYNKCLYVVDED